MTKRKIQSWVIPPEADAEFAANMEEVLETYARPLDPNIPVICMDEQPVQLVKEVREVIPATKDHARREYERAGTACIFMFAEPLSGWRQATARERRTKSDWAHEVATLLDGRYAVAHHWWTPGERLTRPIGERGVSRIDRETDSLAFDEGVRNCRRCRCTGRRSVVRLQDRHRSRA